MNPDGHGSVLVSVIIPAYNAGRYIDDCLDSVLVQRGPFDLEVIVVDDGSTDDTVDRVRRWETARCIQQPNRGPAAARNAALRMAQGGYLAFLDSDDRWPAGKLARQIALLESHPDVGLVFGDCRQFDSQGEHLETLFEQRGYDLSYWGERVTVVDAFAKLIQGNFITTGSVVARRSCVQAVGYFNEDFRVVEDLEYWFRAALSCRFGRTDDVCLLRRRHDTNSSRDQIAMSLAYLSLIEGLQQHGGARVRLEGNNLRRRKVREYQELGHLYLRQGAARHAAGAYLRALRGQLSLRSAYYLALAIAAAIRGSRATRAL